LSFRTTVCISVLYVSYQLISRGGRRFPRRLKATVPSPDFYGEFAREVFDVEIDDRDRLILRARAGDEDGYVPELASRWEVGDD
jgi:hypothetical protein